MRVYQYRVLDKGGEFHPQIKRWWGWSDICKPQLFLTLAKMRIENHIVTNDPHSEVVHVEEAER